MDAGDTYAAVVLAGGAARRLGGVAKPAQPVAGRPMLLRVLAAVGDASPQVVVGPPELPVPPHAVRTQEQPPGSGPVAAAAAGLALVPADAAWVALLAADLPMLTRTAVAALRLAAGDPAVAGAPGAVDGAVFVDHTGRPQWLCGVWRTTPLARAVTSAPAGAALGRVLAAFEFAEVRLEPAAPPPWYDCDTDDDLRRAEEWLT